MRNQRDRDSIVAPVAAVPDIRRRRVLQGMVSGGVLALTGLDAAAQSRASLIALPRRALVIGNSQYKENPLRNPAADANAMAQALERTGFGVSLLLDAGRDQMRNAIQDYGDSLAKQGSIGLFYFAGHGMQLAWRNYLVPVDAVVDNPDDVRERAVDLNALLQGLTRAKNPMNVIILDACRDNPFGTRITTGQKGLSQFDAPPGSLLAYATAPGNVASDGEGANGLYTENLLRELQVPDAKIEDVFKRVRLHVRKKTNGQQIPWESTSLEEDFYFVPPQALMAAAQEEIARERKREEAERAKQLAAEEAERKRRQEEARLAAEATERKRRAELAALEKQHAAEEAERIRKRELALKEAQRVAEDAERKRREEEALREAQRAKEEAERKYQQELALRERQRAQEEAERKRKEEQARLAEEETARKRKEEIALREKQRAQEEAKRREQQAAAAGKPDARAADRQFEEELALWESIKSSKAPGPLEDYLLRYPSGRFAELAQLQLDRILAAQGEKRIEIVSAAENPFSKGTTLAKARFAVGDSYTYRVTDLYTKLEVEKFTQTVTRVTDSEVIYDTGMITDLLGNQLRTRDGRIFTPSQFMPLEFAVGKRWTTRFKLTNASGTGQVELDMRVVAREQITVPAGTFDAFRLEGQGWSVGPWGNTLVNRKVWIAPDQVKRWIASEDFRKSPRTVVASEREELVSYRQA